MLDDVGLVFGVDVSLKVETQLLTYFVALEPTEGATAGAQQGGVFLHFLHFVADLVFVAQGEPFELVLVLGAGVALEHDERVVHVHDAVREKLHFLLVVYLLPVVHYYYYFIFIISGDNL